ncbi:MAG: metallophosphoesterase [Planctomycetes bacterium]|nr:metallophosphoesterase [Planctomycetota bacterium]
MTKHRWVIFVLVLCTAAGAFCVAGIPARIGRWRIEVGPAGNDFYDRSAPEKVGSSSIGGTKDKPPRNKKKFEGLLKKGLGEYRERFNFSNQIKRLGILPKNRDGSFRYVVMGDSRSNWDAFSSIVKHIDMLEPRPAFVINSGDIVPHGYITEYREYYVKAVKETDIPFFVAIGNHDDSSDSKAREYRYLFGVDSLNYYFDYGRNRFVFIDTATKVNDEDDTLEWLDEVLGKTPKGFKKYVTAHKPPKVIEKWAYHAWGSDESKVFVRLMEKHKVSEVYLGHIHAYSTARLNGVRYTVSGGGGARLHGRYGPLGSVRHYLICDIRADGSVKEQVVRFYEAK